jgi:SAM-dependent methyltransferase
MKHQELWKPTKFELRKGKLVSTFNPQYIACGSRLSAQWVADEYTKYIPIYCQGHLADIGCGNLPFYGYYRNFVESTTAIDWESSCNLNCHLDILADLNCPPIPAMQANTFDCAIMSDLLEHIFSPGPLIDEVARILKPGGHVLMNVPFYYYIHEMPHDYHRYTEFALTRYFEQSGFEVVVLNRIGGVGTVLTCLFSQAISRYGFLGRAMATLLQRFALLIRGIRPVRSLLTSGADRVPNGYFLVAKKRGNSV